MRVLRPPRDHQLGCALARARAGIGVGRRDYAASGTPEFSLDGSAGVVEPARPLRLARNQGVEPVGLDPNARQACTRGFLRIRPDGIVGHGPGHGKGKCRERNLEFPVMMLNLMEAPRTSSGTSDWTYLETHPWLTFEVDLRRAPMQLWMLLGEARSKISHLAESLLEPETGDRLREIYLAKGVHATTAIEGNTLSEEEVREHLEGRLRLPPSQEYRTQEIDNIIRAFNRVWKELFQGSSRDLTPEKIKAYNCLILQGLELEPGVIPGELAPKRPAVARYLAPAREECDHLLERLCEWLNSDAFDAPDPEMVVPYAIIKAILAHMYLAWIHYFGDGNGRTARLVELQVLLASAEIPTPAAHLLSNHFNTTRDEYYRRLDASSREDQGDPCPFLLYAIRGLVDELREQLRVVWRQLYDDRWEQYVYRQFGGSDSAPEVRQRQLVLDLSKRRTPVRKSDLRSLSPKVAAAYAKKTDKTLTRDVNALLRRDLIQQVDGGLAPRREKILALLPERVPTSE